MNVHLMYADRDFTVQKQTNPDWEDTISDLELEAILKSMAGKDQFMYSVCRQVLLTPLQTADEIRYRQEILQDCIHCPDVPAAIYRVCIDLE